MKLALKEKLHRFKGDKIILILIALLAAISIILVYSTEGKRVVNHLGHLAVSGIFLFLFYYVFDYKKLLKNFRRGLLLLAIVILFFTLRSSAVRGISLFGHSIQTFYIIGFIIILQISYFIGRRLDQGETLSSNQWMFMGALLFGFCMGIGYLNMSTAIILFTTGLTMFFIGHLKWKWILSILSVVIIGVGGLTFAVSSGKISNIGRIGTFGNRLEYYVTGNNEQGYGDQMIMSRAAIARSGFHPTGPGRGVIKNSLPENSTDYAFASLFEETGISVGIIIILIYIAFFYRAWRIAKNSKSAIGSLLAFGIGFWLTCQAFVHIGVNCEIIPATGQTLPFVSTGGMSLIICGCAAGLLLNVSKNNELEKDEPEPTEIFIRGDRER